MKKNIFLAFSAVIALTFCVESNVMAQSSYKIDVSKAKYEVKRGHLDLGGKGQNEESIEVNNFYLERNGKPFVPVIGEFHYCRYPSQYWDQEIKKMKSGGVTVIATYVFWNMHEPKEGEFNWADDSNLHHFAQLCKDNKIDLIVRIGPFAHGEIRNGGLPDWLYGRPFEVRSNDSEFMKYTEKLYNEIGRQLQGLYYKDGGPVIGIQIENEYQHSAAPWAITYSGAEREYTTARRDRKITQVGVGINDSGNEFKDYGQAYMNGLKTMAKKAGMDVPLYTATGWGFATIINNGSIPVMAGYAFPFWEDKIKPSPFYLFKDIRKTPDYAPVSYITEDYPSIAAELGTGMSVLYSRRPRVPGESFLPMMVRTIGSGSNGLGYYMYHGGTTPSNGFYMYSEGFGLSNKSYDYQSPIREFGNTGKGFYELRLMNNFLNFFGEKLAPLYPVIPQTNAQITADNNATLRYSVRSDGKSGFLFMHNYQDHVQTKDLENLKVAIASTAGNIQFPHSGTFTLKSGSSAVFPFNMKFGSVEFKQATVQPLLNFSNNGKNYFVFFSVDGIKPEVVLNGKIKTTVKNASSLSSEGNSVISGENGKSFEFTAGNNIFLIIPFEKALHTILVGTPEQQYAVISKALVLENGNKLDMISTGTASWDLEMYPKTALIKTDEAKISPLKNSEKIVASWNITTQKVTPQVKISQFDDRHFILDAKDLDLSKLNDVFVKFDYRGDRAICMLNGEIATDNLYTSEAWQVGLKRYQTALKQNEMYFYFMPMLKDAPYLEYLDKNVLPDFSKTKEFLEIKTPEIIPEYKVSIEFNKIQF
ncbi:beta-galactosidase [Flavobacterium sp. LC2016-01]|uniref:beta-galactosidase n=1 Tax=Flavobacterium sp. LC2016-01 TaxID=2675876 RepID=UPI0012BA9DE6|nr:beta-galactosidase [Flavobacterium sp. LC2016-01]MTH17680.1 glycosyl hydrolase family 35 [Flavobacterium sp. LC2016-01]